MRFTLSCASPILDLFSVDSWRNVYAGEREVRPPAAPTIRPTEETPAWARFIGEGNGSARRQLAWRHFVKELASIEQMSFDIIAARLPERDGRVSVAAEHAWRPFS
jgi:hypothetical protein